MRNLLVTVGLLTGFVCAVVPNVAQARTGSAAIGVSVTVVSTCSVTSAPLATKPVNVSCSYNTPFSVAQTRGTLADVMPAGPLRSPPAASAPRATSPSPPSPTKQAGLPEAVQRLIATKGHGTQPATQRSVHRPPHPMGT